MYPVTHFELPVDDPDRAQTFYGDAFGWTVDSIPMGDASYLMTTTVDPSDEDVIGINGAFIDRVEPLVSPVLTIEVPSIDDIIETVEAAGGSVIVPREAASDMGYFAYIEDTEGNVIGLWQSLS